MDNPLKTQTYYEYIDTALKEMPVGIALYDAQTLCLLMANPLFHTFLDPAWQGGRALGRPLTTWLPHAEEAGVANLFRTVATTGVSYKNDEYAYAGFERGMTYWNWTLDPVRDSDGRIVQIVETTTEITSQVLARQKVEEDKVLLEQEKRDLETEQKRLKVIEIIEVVARSVRDSLDIQSISKALIQAIITNFDSHVVYLHRSDAAQQALHLLQIHPQPLQEDALRLLQYVPYGASSYLASVHKQRDPIILEDLQVEVAQERFAGEGRLMQPDVHGYICVPLWFGDHFEGALTAVLKEHISVNDPLAQALMRSSVYIAAALAQARLHAVVKGEQERLRAILDQLPEGILIGEAINNTITYANAAAEQILGLPIHSLLGSSLISYRGIEIVSNTDVRLPWNFVITEALDGSTIRSQEAMLTRADGSKVIVLGSAAPLRSDTGAITGILLVFQDITAQKSVEQHKKEFLSIASHELRTPIAAIQGFAEILQMQASKEKILSPQSLRAITFINEQSQSLTRLIEEMLDITRIENAQLQLDIATHDLVSTIAHVIETQATTAPEHHLQFVLDGLPSPAKLMGKFDENRIVQVLNNLISNAVKYSRAGSNIEVGLRRCSRNAGNALIWVKDSGIGISAHELPHIFKRFHRASRIDPSISGLGIGLYLVQELVTHHGGRVWAESTEKSGSTFYVQLPLHIEHLAPQLN